MKFGRKMGFWNSEIRFFWGGGGLKSSILENWGELEQNATGGLQLPEP